jgi:Predicted membrane protein
MNQLIVIAFDHFADALGAMANWARPSVRPGRSALFLVVKEFYADATLAALRQFRGDVIQTSLDSEAEEALRETLE